MKFNYLWLLVLGVLSLTACKKERTENYIARKDTSLLSEKQARSLILNQAVDQAEDKSVSQQNQFAFQAPKHWQKQTASGFRVASYLVSKNELKVDVSVTKFPGDVGGDLANVNRWRNQLGLSSISNTQLNSDFTSFKVGAISIKSIQYNSADKAILAAIIFRNNESWFVKLMGDKTLVDQEKRSYRSFLESFKIL